MFRVSAYLSFVLVFWALLASADPQLAGAQTIDVKELRVVAGVPLERLSDTVDFNVAPITTPELRNHLSRRIPGATAVAVLITKAGNGPTDMVWYTDFASQKPRVIDNITRNEHDLLYAFAQDGLVSVLTVKIGPQTVSKTVTLPDGQVRTVKETRMVSLTDQQIAAVLGQIDSYADPGVRRALEFAAGGKFAEAFPEAGPAANPTRATALAANYRHTVLQNAQSLISAKPDDELPSVGQPFFVLGKAPEDAASVAKAVEGASPAASFDTRSGRFAAVWDKSTLVVVRQPKTWSPDPLSVKVRLSSEWLGSLDPSNKSLQAHVGRLSEPQ